MRNKFIVYMCLICFCILLGLLFTKSSLSQKNDPNNIYVKPVSDNIYLIDIGEVEYGSIHTKSIKFISEYDVNQIQGLKRTGCASCSNVKIGDCNSLSDKNIFQCQFIFDHKGKQDELGEHKDLFKILAKDGSVLGGVQISHTIVLSKHISPNTITIKNMIPKKEYSISFRKNIPFSIESVKLDIPQLHITDWKDNKDSLDITFYIDHTFENMKNESKLSIYMDSKKRFMVPVHMDIKEKIQVEPRNIFLGKLDTGQVATQTIKIISDESIDISKCTIDLEDCEYLINKINKYETDIELSIYIGALKQKGAFKSSLKIELNSTEYLIEVPIYGVVQENFH